MANRVGLLGFQQNEVVVVNFDYDGVQQQDTLRVYTQGDPCPGCKDGTYVLEMDKLVNGVWDRDLPKCEKWLKSHAVKTSLPKPVKVTVMLSHFNATVEESDLLEYQQTGVMSEAMRGAVEQALRVSGPHTLIGEVEPVCGWKQFNRGEN